MRLLMTAALLAIAMCASAQVSVIEHGAIGDGLSDDTAVFQAALDSCAEKGGIVTVPAGTYLIAGHLNIPAAVTLEGTWRAPATVNAYHDPEDPLGGPLLKGSVLLVTEGAGEPDATPFIMLNFNSTLKGVTIFYPEQTKTNPPIEYPWTVASAGADNCAIVDVLMVNPYQAVDFGTRVAGRHYIRNLYAEPLRRGLFVDLCLDVGRLENIHFWPFWTAADGESPIGDFRMEQGEAFIFGRSDWEYVSNCFAISYNTGFRFIASKGAAPFTGGGNYLLSQSGADMCQTAVRVEELQEHSGASFSNSQIFGDIIVDETNHGMLRFTGCGIFGSINGANGVAAAKLDGRGRTSFSNCHFYAIHPEAQADMMIHALGGRLSVVGCVFINSRVTTVNLAQVVLEPEVMSAVIMGNEFYGEERIDNRCEGEVQIGMNVAGTDLPDE